MLRKRKAEMSREADGVDGVPDGRRNAGTVHAPRRRGHFAKNPTPQRWLMYQPSTRQRHSSTLQVQGVDGKYQYAHAFGGVFRSIKLRVQRNENPDARLCELQPAARRCKFGENGSQGNYGHGSRRYIEDTPRP